MRALLTIAVLAGCSNGIAGKKDCEAALKHVDELIPGASSAANPDVLVTELRTCDTESEITACITDAKDVKALKKCNYAEHAQCRAILRHIVQITPDAKGDDPVKVVADLPVEDFQACGAMEPEERACMLVTPNVEGVKKCIPTEEVVSCYKTAEKARKAARTKAHGEDKADEPDPAIDGKFDAIRARCWAGDTHAADAYKPKE